MIALEELEEMTRRPDGAEDSQERSYDPPPMEAPTVLIPESCDSGNNLDTGKLEENKQEMQILAGLSEPEAIQTSCVKIMSQAEQLTQRNMKTCVAEYIIARCQDDPEVARLVAHPRKSLIHCIHYINRMAMNYLQEQEKLERACNGERENLLVKNLTPLGGSVPDGVCYEWAEAYFRDPNAEEDEEKKEIKKTIPPVKKASRRQTQDTRKAAVEKPSKEIGKIEETEEEEYQLHL